MNLTAQLAAIQAQLDRIEAMLAYQSDPANAVTVAEKAQIVKRAARGGREGIKQAMKQINGGNR